MNQQILFVMRSLDNPELFTSAEKVANSKEAYITYVAADADADSFNPAVYTAYASDAIESTYDISITEAADWLARYFKSTGEDIQTYIDEVERLNK